MAELSALRARLKDRQVKEGALGTVEFSFCLDLGLLSELDELETEKAKANDAAKAVGDTKTLAGGAVKADPAVSKLDKAIGAKKDEIRAQTLLVVFRAVSSVKYREIVNRFEDPNTKDSDAFLAALVTECFLECWNSGEKVDLRWDEIRPETSMGEYEQVCTDVFALNRRRQDVPFSLKPSRKARS